MTSPDVPPPIKVYGASPAGLTDSVFDRRWPRLALVVIIALGIVEITWIVGQKQG